jgi:hypothetical protein
MGGSATRRGLLAGGAALAGAQNRATAAQPADPRARFAALGLGANLERWFPIASDARPRRLGRAWWQGLREAGFDHARLFLPSDAGDGEAVPRLFLTAVEDANAAGLPVLLGLDDLFESTAPSPGWRRARGSSRGRPTRRWSRSRP